MLVKWCEGEWERWTWSSEDLLRCSFNLLHCGWSQHGRHWNTLFGFATALTFELYIVTWPRGHGRINYIYKTLLCFLLASTCIKQTSNTIWTQKHRNIQQEVFSGHQILQKNNNNILNIFHYQNTLSKRCLQRQTEKYWTTRVNMIKTTKVFSSYWPHLIAGFTIYNPGNRNLESTWRGELHGGLLSSLLSGSSQRLFMCPSISENS